MQTETLRFSRGALDARQLQLAFDEALAAERRDGLPTEIDAIVVSESGQGFDGVLVDILVSIAGSFAASGARAVLYRVIRRVKSSAGDDALGTEIDDGETSRGR